MHLQHAAKYFNKSLGYGVIFNSYKTVRCQE